MPTAVKASLYILVMLGIASSASTVAYAVADYRWWKVNKVPTRDEIIEKAEAEARAKGWQVMALPDLNPPEIDTWRPFLLASIHIIAFLAGVIAFVLLCVDAVDSQDDEDYFDASA